MVLPNDVYEGVEFGERGGGERGVDWGRGGDRGSDSDERRRRRLLVVRLKDDRLQSAENSRCQTHLNSSDDPSTSYPCLYW